MSAREPALVRHSLGLAASHYLSRLLLLLRAAASAAALGPGGFGTWNALNLILDFGGYASIGALQGLELELPPAASRRDEERSRRIMSAAWGMVVIGAAAFGAIVVAVLGMRRGGMLVTWGYGPPLLMVAAAWLQLAFQYHASCLKAHGDFDTVSAAQSVQATIGAGLGLALVWRTGVWGLLGGWLVGSAAGLAWLWRSPHRVPFRPRGVAHGGALVRLGLPIFAVFALSQVLRSLDRIAFVRLAPAERLGHYSLGLLAAGLVLYLPESAAMVLYPRIASASQGARDPVRTRDEVIRTHRALGVLVPAVVGLGMVWAAPLTGWLLPEFREGVDALYRLSIGALMLSSATVPAYFLLASGAARPLLATLAGVTLSSAALVFSVAARDPRPASVAVAASLGYAVFALAVIALASRRLFDRGVARARFALAGLAPAIVAAALALAACHVGPRESLRAALLRSAAFVLAYLPLAIAFGRGLGLTDPVRAAWRRFAKGS